METRTILLFTLSAVPALLIWPRIVRQDSNIFLKTIYIVFTAIPIFGPVFYLMMFPPLRSPVDNNAIRGKGTVLIPTFKPLLDALKGRDKPAK